MGTTPRIRCVQHVVASWALPVSNVGAPPSLKTLLGVLVSTAQRVNRVKQQYTKLIGRALNKLVEKVATLEPRVAAHTITVSHDKTAVTEQVGAPLASRVVSPVRSRPLTWPAFPSRAFPIRSFLSFSVQLALSARVQFEGLQLLVNKCRAFFKQATSLLSKGAFIANSEEIRERARFVPGCRQRRSPHAMALCVTLVGEGSLSPHVSSVLAAKSRSAILATSQALRACDGNPSAVEDQDVYRNTGYALQDLERALDAFAEKVCVALPQRSTFVAHLWLLSNRYDVGRGWKVEGQVSSVGDLAFLLPQHRQPFTIQAGKSAPVTALLVLRGANAFQKFLVHTPRYRNVRHHVCCVGVRRSAAVFGELTRAWYPHRPKLCHHSLSSEAFRGVMRLAWPLRLLKFAFRLAQTCV